VAKDLSSTRLLPGLAALALALGLWQLGGAAAIHAKAWLAQRLLDDAWAATLAGGETVKPWPWADTWPVARLQVPELEIDLYVLAGASGRTLAFGPAVVPGTEGLDHRILSGHRDTHFAFLRDLDDGTRLRLQDRSGAWRDYRVSGRQVIDVRRPLTARRADAGQEIMTLVTCYPFDAIDPGGPLRYAVTAEATTAAPEMAQALTSTVSGGIETGEGLPHGAF
jgi:sortase A